MELFPSLSTRTWPKNGSSGHSPEGIAKKKMKLFIRRPTNSGVDYGITRWIAWASRTFLDADMGPQYSAGLGVAEARNDMSQAFMGSDCTHLWMVDADVIPPENTALVEAAQTHPVVCGPYNGFHVDEGVLWHVYEHTRTDATGKPLYRSLYPHRWPEGKKTFKVDAAGTGNMIIQRKVFDRLPERPFKHTVYSDGMFGGEDFGFCQDVGGVHVNVDSISRHIRDCDLLDIWNWAERRTQAAIDITRVQLGASNGRTNADNVHQADRTQGDHNLERAMV
jgi:hypothetical protein